MRTVYIPIINNVERLDLAAEKDSTPDHKVYEWATEIYGDDYAHEMLDKHGYIDIRYNNGILRYLQDNQ